MEIRTRVVVTGIGVVTSIGVGRDAFWRHLLEGRCGISPVQSFDTSRYTVHLGGEVHGFHPEQFVRRLPVDSIGRASQLAIAAARLAFEDATVAIESFDPLTVGVSIGTTSGEPALIERFDDLELAGARDRIGPEFVRQYPCHVIGARIYAEVAGYGLTCDASHMTAPQGDGAVRAMQIAMADAGVTPDDVSYISAHGTGTSVNDRIETRAVKQAFGDSAQTVPMSSIKSMLGHTMGAASAIEAAACALAVWDDHVPPTIHLDERDPECDLDYVANVSRATRVEVAMNNAYAFGGNNASLIVRKCRT